MRCVFCGTKDEMGNVCGDGILSRGGMVVSDFSASTFVVTCVGDGGFCCCNWRRMCCVTWVTNLSSQCAAQGPTQNPSQRLPQ